LNGYFQKSNIFLYLRQILLKYFNVLNNTYINNTYINNYYNIPNEHKISDFCGIHTKHTIECDKSLILHLRLDDFIHNNSPPNIFDMVELSKYIDSISFTKLYIVCDILTKNWEIKYVNYFTNKYNAIILNGTFMDDFNLLKLSNRLVTSQSTFCWIAAYLGNAQEVFIPYSNFHKEHQILKECHENCTIKYDIPFASDLSV